MDKKTQNYLEEKSQFHSDEVLSPTVGDFEISYQSEDGVVTKLDVDSSQFGITAVADGSAINVLNSVGDKVKTYSVDGDGSVNGQIKGSVVTWKNGEVVEYQPNAPDTDDDKKKKILFIVIACIGVFGGIATLILLINKIPFLKPFAERLKRVFRSVNTPFSYKKDFEGTVEVITENGAQPVFCHEMWDFLKKNDINLLRSKCGIKNVFRPRRLKAKGTMSFVDNDNMKHYIRLINISSDDPYLITYDEELKENKFDIIDYDTIIKAS